MARLIPTASMDQPSLIMIRLGGIKGQYEVSISRRHVMFADAPKSKIQLLDVGTSFLCSRAARHTRKHQIGLSEWLRVKRTTFAEW